MSNPDSQPGKGTQPRIPLNDGTTMPQLGLGVWRTPADETADIVRYAADAGYLAVDTAAIYKNEEGVGDGLADRPGIYVTTKLWNDDQGYDATMRAFETSLRKLRREVLDLYLIHWPRAAEGRFVETWKAMVALQKDGRVRSIGVSNFRPEDLDRVIAATGVVPAVNQIELHPRFQQRALRAFHEKHGIRTESWSPLGQGQVLEDPVIAEIGRKYGKTPAQVVIRWHLDSGLIVIPKSVTPKRIVENISVFDFALDAEDMRRIAGLDRADGRIGPDPATF
ncbi:aldo/keto reductase [Gluconacetobacter sp. 1b LMG 1731]|uniref:Aldo/keto reductase n=1 Tax=Gluconacetobacter dulcium TaxID=2729096 RepID=A0A7W4IPB1_9PROT|nr:aldo/keto reductase [Gluconacetobacter dulcium]MBB2166444.1 aldo/keto reductase [Gluconacetobacter dulcium]MBB2195548.1 aldo/keto reductase [Gluconacetobacter dulcium]